MSAEVSSHEKGLALELKLRDLFKSKGYEVLHNVKRKGRSGAEHQIDVLAEYRCPLHTSRVVVVEAKSYDAPVDKDRIMKLIQIVDDLGADRGIIVTTSYFTPGAIQTAEGHSVELWDRERLVKLLGEVEMMAVEKGLPDESEDDVIETLELIDKLRDYKAFFVPLLFVPLEKCLLDDRNGAELDSLSELRWKLLTECWEYNVRVWRPFFPEWLSRNPLLYNTITKFVVPSIGLVAGFYYGAKHGKIVKNSIGNLTRYLETERYNVL